MKKLLVLATICTVLFLILGVKRVSATCSPTQCNDGVNKCDPATEQCSPNKCCDRLSSDCGVAAAPACNGWCAAGTSCSNVGGSCSCTSGGGGGGGGGGGCGAGYQPGEYSPVWEQCQSGGCVSPSYVVCQGGDPSDNCCGTRSRPIKCHHLQCVPIPSPSPCLVTAPSGLSGTSTGGSSATISWTPGTGGSSQRFYLDNNANNVASNCPGASCLIKNEGLGAAQNSYATGNVLTEGTTYTYKIVNYSSGSCSQAATSSFLHSFIQNSWFQVDKGSIHAAGSISSQIPVTCTGSCIPALITQSSVGSSGLASFGSGSLSVGQGTISEDGTDWQANTVYHDGQTGYEYFNRILSEDPAGIGVWDGSLPGTSGVFSGTAAETSGGAWTVGAGDEIVILADSDLTIANDITVAQGGFLAIISSGNITFADAVTHVEGVFISDGSIITGTGANQLVGEGIFAGWTGISLGRDLGADNNLNPAEYFVYRPDLQMNAYKYLEWLNLAWKEVAP